jgi:hypothetical protein
MLSFLDSRQKRTGWTLVAVSAGYIVWFFKVRLIEAGPPIATKEWLIFAGMSICLMLGTANLRMAAMREDKQRAEPDKKAATRP